MKKLLLSVGMILVCVLTVGGEKKMEENIKWLGHSSILIEREGKNIYVDPWKIKTGKADLILITHSHYDHCSPDDVNKIADERTTIIATPDSLEKLKKALRKQYHLEMKLTWVG